MVPCLHLCVRVNYCQSVWVLCVCWALCLSVSVDERVKHMCLCGGLPFWCRSLHCFVLFYTEVFVCVVCHNLLCQIFRLLLSRVGFLSVSRFIYLCMCVYTLLCVFCFPWGSVSMLVAWDAYDHFYGCLSSSGFFDLFVCLHEVFVMRYVDFCQHSSAF